MTIKSRDLPNARTIIDVAVQNGANQVYGLNFQLSKAREDELRAQALAEATKKAREKAEVIADSLGVTLDKVTSVSESNYYYQPYKYRTMDAAMPGKAMAESAEVLPQDLTVTASITVGYSVK